MKAPLAELEDIQEVLRDAGYTSNIGPLGAVSRVLMARNPYGLVCCVETESWAHLSQFVSDVQAELTHVAIQEGRASIRWDLYLVTHIRNPSLQPIDSATLDRIESDTKYARKFVRVNLTSEPGVLDRALRPFLPLRPQAHLEVADPIDLLRQELSTEGISQQVVEHALRQFRADGTVGLP